MAMPLARQRGFEHQRRLQRRFGWVLNFAGCNGNTATEILLNRVGTTPANPFGSSGSGFNVTLSDSGTVNGNIHGAAGLPTGRGSRIQRTP